MSLIQTIPGSKPPPSDTPSRTYLDELRQASHLCDTGSPDEAYKIADKWLLQNPNDPLCLLVMSHVLWKGKKTTVAYSMAKRVTEMKPDRPEGWLNLGKCANDLWRLDEAIACYETALALPMGIKQRLVLLTNLSAVYIDNAQFGPGEVTAREALKLDSTDHKSRHNLGICLLARREWVEGWKYYSASIGTEARKHVQYASEPIWDGKHKKRIVIYGEQGLGDEIVFASMFPDAIRDSKHTIIECDVRLRGLFRRSFPDANVYGTRNVEMLNWHRKDQEIDASISSAELGKFYRRLDSDFPSEPYLKVCPDRKLMWRNLFASKGKPCIGIAWTGGTWKNGAMHRRLTEEELAPLLALDCHFVSLQYKPGDMPGITTYPFATLTNDYDDTAAMVAALDCVVSVPTSVVHLAAAIGTPTIAIHSSKPCWKFQGGLAWHPKVQLAHSVFEAVNLLCSKFSLAPTVDNRSPTPSSVIPSLQTQRSRFQSVPSNLTPFPSNDAA